MIDVSLAFVRQVLDQYMVTSFAQEPGTVVLNNLTSPDGGMPPKNQNKLVLTLVNLEYETNRQYYGGLRPGQEVLARVNPALLFNLDVLVSANFDDYGEALKLLTATIAFFQEHLALTRDSYPLMPVGLNMLKFEIENSPSTKTHNLWTALGAKYLPSIIYKIRHVAIQSDQIKSLSSPVQSISAAAAP